MPTQIYFIDTKLNNYQTIIDSLSSSDKYFLIDSSSDGLTQMSNILLNYSNLDSIHVYSHGDVGSLNIGNTVYDNANISNYKIELENIGKSLSTTGDILLYGCNVGQDEIGKNFINQIAQFSQADVAASDDLTGNSNLGGDWDLEVVSGVVETQVNIVEEYKSTLVTNTAPTFLIGDGKVTTDFGADDWATSITIQSDGKILVAGTSYDDSYSDGDIVIARYNSDGSLDTSFSRLVTTDSAGGIIVQSDGKILVNDISGRDFELARYNSDGSLDTSFSSDGLVTTDFGSYDFGSSITMQSDGKILIAGESNSNFAIARYNSDGSLDTSFSSDGLVTTNFGGYDYGSSITMQSDGKILFAGSSSLNSDFVIARYNSNGSLDTTFSSDGLVTTDFGGYDSVVDITIQSDGKILVAGHSNNDFAIARYNSDGSLDTTFSDDGKVTTDFGADDWATSITIQSDGKILVAGTSNDDFAIARYNSDGSLDTTFSDDGKVTTDFGADDWATSSTIQSDGKILVAGFSNQDFAIARYNSDGSLDTSFSEYQNTIKLTENLLTSEIIYKAIVTDIDKDILTYSLSGTDANLLNIDSTTGAVTLKTSANYEAKNSYSFNVIASDGSLTASKAITVNVTNVNEYTPKITSTSTGTIAENALNTTVIYKATASDADANTTLIYSLSGTDASLLNINSATGDVTLKSSANYEAKNSYSFNVIASDGSLTDLKAVTVNVSNVNEFTPKITSIATGSVAENEDKSTVIYTATASDVDANTTLKYSLSGTDAALLNIDSETGEVTLKSSANYEAKKSYSFNVIASDGSLAATKAVVVNVTNVNEAPTITSIDTGIVKENALTSTVIYKTIASDVDKGSVLKYSLSGEDASLLNINSTTGAVTLKSSANYEAKDSYNFSVTVSDGKLSSSKDIMVDVTNVNEAPKITSSSSGSVAENSELSTVIYAIEASDVDANTTLKYSLSGKDASLLNIDSETGEVTLKSSANFEAKKSYSFNVIASDEILSSTKAVVVNVTNVNEAPTITSIDTGIVKENALTSTVIYKATASDVDKGTILTYSLDGEDADLLNISSTGVVTLKSSANYEAKNTYSFNVIASDGSLSSSKDITVNVTNVNETPTITSIATGSIEENEDKSTVIYTATASDVDANTTLKYSLSGTDAALLNINSTTGEVTLKTSANYEAKKSYSFNVIASDGSLAATKAVVVNVTNVNEAPTITSSLTGSVAENSATSTVIYKATASDVDKDILTYTLSGADKDLLNINSTTGEVTLKSSANYEAKNSYNFDVIASDGSLSSSKAVVVNVGNVNEAPTILNINSTLTMDAIDTILDNSEDLGEVDLVEYGNLTTHTSTQMIYKYIGSNGDNYTETFIGSNLKPTTLPTTFTITKMTTKNDTTGQVSTIEGNFKYNLDSSGNETFVSLYVSKITETITYDSGKFLTATISADKIVLDENDEVTTDIKNFKYEISDGLGGNITFSTALLKVSDYNNIINGDLTLKETFEYFSKDEQIHYLDGNDTISIAKNTELFLNEDEKSELNGYLGNDTLIGSILSDILIGGLGNDILSGGAGADTFVFNTTLNGTINKDVIKDFNVIDDTIHLSSDIFTQLIKEDILNSDNFVSNTTGKAIDDNDYIVYNKTNGQLFYDADGSGNGAAILVATLENKANITSTDFTVI